MNLEMLDLVRDTRWYCYRQLELVSRFVPSPIRRPHPLASGLNVLWRSLLTLLMDELVDEQRVEYLERCLSLNEFGEGDQSPSSFLGRLWFLMR